jgi:hypothetical protein
MFSNADDLSDDYGDDVELYFPLEPLYHFDPVVYLIPLPIFAAISASERRNFIDAEQTGTVRARFREFATLDRVRPRQPIPPAFTFTFTA